MSTGLRATAGGVGRPPCPGRPASHLSKGWGLAVSQFGSFRCLSRIRSTHALLAAGVRASPIH
jgi:hypothetical protein